MSSKHRVATGTVSRIETGWHETVLICGKCSDKLDGGFGEKGRETLRSALRQILRARRERGGVRIIETRCFGICPRKGVTVARGSTPGELLVLGKGADPAALLDEAADALPPPNGPQPPLA